MDPLLHTGDQRIVEIVDFPGRTGYEESEDSSIGWKGHGDHLEYPGRDPHRLSTEENDQHINT